MALELTAVRLLAPHFGDSAYVWTNVIGVILVGLALGAWLGGRLAHPEAGRRRLAIALWASAGLAAVVPLWSGPLGAFLLPQDLPLDAAMPALVRGSFVATALLFAPPVVCIGCVSPLLISSLAAVDGRVGRAAGAVGAASTIGSLFGTFAATHWLVPTFGSRSTVWVSAGILAAAAVSAGWRPRLAAATGIAFVGAMLGVSGRPMRAPDVGETLLAEVESSYQYLQVLEREDGSRALEINEGLDSAHSVAFPAKASSDGEFVAQPFTQGWYYDSFAALPFLVGEGRAPDELRVLSLGDAAGTFARMFDACFPGLTFDGVELDPAVSELGESWFGGFSGNANRYSGVDARVFVEHASRAYHVVLVDAYENQVYIPAHVASVEFFAAVRRRLVPGGVVAVNAGGIGFDAPVPLSMARTMGEVFESVAVYRVPRSRNLMIVGRDGPIEASILAGAASDSPELDRVLARVGAPLGWRRLGDLAGGEVLVDDRPVLDRMLEGSLASAGEASLAEIAGSSDEAAAVARARELLAVGDGAGAVAALVGVTEESASVRYWLGAARWTERDLMGAEREFERAVELAGPGEFTDFVLGEAQNLAQDLAQHRKAASTARQNLWLAGIVVAVWLGLVVGGLLRPRARVAS